MKTLIVFIISFAFFSPCFSQQNLRLAFPDEITYRGDMAYFHDSPFTGLLVDKKTNRQLGEFRNGYKNGVFTKYYTDGKKKAEGKYSMGIKNGAESEWYENGQQKSTYTYINGKLADGVYVMYYENGGKSREERIKNGLIVDGDYPVFNERGVQIETISYKNNVVISVKNKNGKYKQYYNTGQLKSEGYLNNQGIQNGQFTDWWQNGHKKDEGSKINGKLNGRFTTWNENSDKTSEQYFKNGKQDSIETIWEKNGNIKTQYFKEGVLVKETLKNSADLISNNFPAKNEYLYLFLTEEGAKKVFVKVIIDDRTISYDALKKTMVANLLASMKPRLIYTPDWYNYNNEYISYTIEFSNLRYYAESSYSDLAGSTMYHGECAYRIKLLDNQNKLLDNEFYNSNTKRSIIVTSYGDRHKALSKGIKKASSEYFVYKNFPIKSDLIKINKTNKSKAKLVKISSGYQKGVKRKLRFNIYSGNFLESSIIGELEAENVYPTYSICKVTKGEEAVLKQFNSTHKLKIISKL